MTVEATVQIWRDGQTFVAHAMPVDVASASSRSSSRGMMCRL